MTQEDWKEAEERLKSLYYPVKLICDGYKVTLSLERISEYKNAILVYVNGVCKLEWMDKDCEERRRFFRPTKKYLFSRKQKAAMKKISKRSRQKYGLPDPEKAHIYYIPYWTSFRMLKSHLVKQNSAIAKVENF